MQKKPKTLIVVVDFVNKTKIYEKENSGSKKEMEIVMKKVEESTISLKQYLENVAAMEKVA